MRAGTFRVQVLEFDVTQRPEWLLKVANKHQPRDMLAFCYAGPGGGLHVMKGGLP